MLRNYFLVAIRNLSSHKLFSVINVLGLTIGLACVMLIALFVRSEVGFDTQWANADRTYRVMRNFDLPGSGVPLYLATNAPPVGPLLKLEFPQFEQVVRLMDNTAVLSMNDSADSYYEAGLYFADPEVFAVFDIPLLQGNPQQLFTGPFQAVIDESLAQKYFPAGGALGGTITMSGDVPVRVTGIMANLPRNTHLDAHAFVSMQTAEVIFGETMQSWGFNNFHTYVVAAPGYDMAQFEAQSDDFFRRHMGEDAPSFTSFSTIKVTDIHLQSHRDNELQANGSATVVLTFSAIAVFILLIACFNFMNLSTARSLSRAREVGMRKVCGASRGQIALQFLTESIVIAAIAVCVSTLLVLALLPAFNALLGTSLNLDLFGNIWVLPALCGLVLLVGTLAGLYPALYLASFPAATILRGELSKGRSGVVLRKALVVLQFTISIALVISSGIALAQLRYAQSLDVGFQKEHILIYRGSGQAGLGDDYETMKQELLRHPQIVSVTAANLMPGDQNTNADGFRYEGGGPEPIGMGYLNVDFDFFETFGIEFLAGRSFSAERGTDLLVEPTEEMPRTSASFILNELAAQQLGWSASDAEGKWLESVMDREATRVVRGNVIGVVDNIYFSSIRETIKPVYYRVMTSQSSTGSFPNLRSMAVRVTGDNLDATLAYIDTTWNRFVPGVPIRQTFLDADFQALYEGERRQGVIFTWFSAMAIFIAALGLFGLASYMTGQRTREIGIRKVLGSSVGQLVGLLTKDFLILVFIAMLLAWPLAAYFMNGWLQSFAYRVGLNPLIFVMAGGVAIVIAALTVGLLVARTASNNPALSLRHE
jgi:putative ABC transport system permease protein